LAKGSWQKAGGKGQLAKGSWQLDNKIRKQQNREIRYGKWIIEGSN
jgi:hypothetical protein